MCKDTGISSGTQRVKSVVLNRPSSEKRRDYISAIDFMETGDAYTDNDVHT